MNNADNFLTHWKIDMAHHHPHKFTFHMKENKHKKAMAQYGTTLMIFGG